MINSILLFHISCLVFAYILERFNKVQSAVSRGVLFTELQGEQNN